VDLRDVRVIQRGERFCFALEAHHPISIACEGGGQYLDCNLAIEARIARALHFAHSANAPRIEDAIRAE
jgi:hypothetical protein